MAVDEPGGDASFALAAQIVENLPDAVVVYRGDKVLFVNPAARRMLGDHDGAVLVGNSPIAMIDPLDHATVKARVAQLEAGESVEPQDIRFRVADGSTVVLEVVSLPVTLHGERAVLAVARDLGSRREAQHQRMEAYRADTVATLAAGAAHEINNPLTYVITNLDYAISELRGEVDAGTDPARRAAVLEALSEAQEGADRIRLLIRDLRSYSSHEDTRTSVDVRRVLDRSANLVAGEFADRAQIIRDLRPVPAVLASEGAIGQVCMNLLINASQAITPGNPANNVVRVRSWTDERGYACVEVSDTGHGMNADVRARIFDPFFTTKRGGGGNGLGLAICDRIVRRLGGEITVESAPRMGAIFTISLPPCG